MHSPPAPLRPERPRPDVLPWLAVFASGSSASRAGKGFTPLCCPALYLAAEKPLRERGGKGFTPPYLAAEERVPLRRERGKRSHPALAPRSVWPKRNGLLCGERGGERFTPLYLESSRRGTGSEHGSQEGTLDQTRFRAGAGREKETPRVMGDQPAGLHINPLKRRAQKIFCTEIARITPSTDSRGMDGRLNKGQDFDDSDRAPSSIYKKKKHPAIYRPHSSYTHRYSAAASAKDTPPPD